VSAAVSGNREPTNDGRGHLIPSHGRGALRPFQKGVSGNPSGIGHNDYHIARKICAEHSVEAIHRQLELMRSDDERVAFMATEAILNRGIGKPRDHSAEDQARTIVNLDNLTDDERALLAKLMGKVLPKDAP